MQLLFLGLYLLFCSAKAISLRDYCDYHVYRLYGKPQFLGNPRPYILPYYKRCIDYTEWTNCVTKLRKKPVQNITVEPFERSIPPDRALFLANKYLCSRIEGVRSNKPRCEVDTARCTNLYTSGDHCKDSAKRANCLWFQLSKCDAKLELLMNYEYGMLGGKCLEQIQFAVYPFSRSRNKNKFETVTCRGPDIKKKSSAQMTAAPLASVFYLTVMEAAVMLMAVPGPLTN